MAVSFRNKIIRPLYPLSLAVLGLCFAFHFGEFRGTVAISSDSEKSKDNYFEAATWLSDPLGKELQKAIDEYNMVIGLSAEISPESGAETGSGNAAGENEEPKNGESQDGTYADITQQQDEGQTNGEAEPAPNAVPSDPGGEQSDIVTEALSDPVKPPEDGNGASTETEEQNKNAGHADLAANEPDTHLCISYLKPAAKAADKGFRCRLQLTGDYWYN